MNYYDEIKDKLVKNEICKKIREYYSNRNDLATYYEVGKLLSEAGKHYGEGIIKKYSIELEKDIGKKYSDRMLRNMRKFYLTFRYQKWKPLVSKLSWSHIIVLLSIQDINEINYYINQCINNSYSRRELIRTIKSKEYKRLDDKTKLKLIKQEELTITDFIKDPIILNKTKDYDRITEYVLKEIIMNDLSYFLKQLGNGFCYIDNEYKIKIGETYNYIDILLFNIVFNCYVVVELKINQLKKQDIGQIQIYMNYIDKNIKSINHDRTIGIIICKIDNKLVLEYSSDNRIYSTEYILV